MPGVREGGHLEDEVTLSPGVSDKAPVEGGPDELMPYQSLEVCWNQRAAHIRPDKLSQNCGQQWWSERGKGAQESSAEQRIRNTAPPNHASTLEPCSDKPNGKITPQAFETATDKINSLPGSGLDSRPSTSNNNSMNSEGTSSGDLPSSSEAGRQRVRAETRPVYLVPSAEILWGCSQYN